jgi:hypothetical protein
MLVSDYYGAKAGYITDFVTIEEAIFQSVCLQFRFFTKLRLILNRAYGLFSLPSFTLRRLNLVLNRIIDDCSKSGIGYDFTFMFQNDDNASFFAEKEKSSDKLLTIEDHQHIGKQLRFYMQELIIISAATKEKYGKQSAMYLALKRVYELLISLRNILIDKLRVYLNKQKLRVQWDQIHYACAMSCFANALEYQLSVVTGLSLEADLTYYCEHLINASCLHDFP